MILSCVVDYIGLLTYITIARAITMPQNQYILHGTKKKLRRRGRHAAAAGSGCAMFRRMRFNSSNISLKRRTAVGATDFLRRDDKLAALLPSIFQFCEILAFEDGQLLLSTPNASLAAKLKQQLPKLQETLARRGWQVTGVKLKVQMMKPAEIKEQMRSLSLTEAAVTAFDELGDALEQSPQNATLIAALKAMVARRRNGAS